MKKIGIVVPALEHSGGVGAVARFVKDAALRSGRYAPCMVSLCMASNEATSLLLRRPSTWSAGVRTHAGQWEGLPFVHVGARFAELEFQRYMPRPALAAVLRECDLIQVVAGAPAWANAVVGLGKPVALQVATRARVERRQRDSQIRHPIDLWRRLMTEITDKLDNRGLHHVDAIQVENPWMLEYAAQLNRDRRLDLRYAPPGIDASLFRPAGERGLDASPYILCVGRLGDIRKNLVLLARAYAALPAALQARVRLVLAGASAPPPAFWSLASALGIMDRIEFHHRPPREELICLVQGAAVFALPSDEEGLGVALLEAMACGIPAVATRCGGPEGIITDGEDGFLVPRDDFVRMACRLQVLLEDPVRNVAMGLRARITVEERYEEGRAGQVFVDMWDRLCEASQR